MENEVARWQASSL